MEWFTINLIDPQTGEQLTTQQHSTDQCSAELAAQQRITADGERLVVVSIYR